MKNVADEKLGEEDRLEVPMYFLARSDIYNTVKPYAFQYYIKEEFPLHNLERVPQNVQVKSMRRQEQPVSLDAEGFDFCKITSKMAYSDFDNEKTIEDVYCRELEGHLKEMLGARHVRALDYQIRRRESTFPYFPGKLPPSAQPSLMTHIDVTPSAAASVTRVIYKDVADDILKARHQIVTVWKPLRTPVDDWPLAICDARSISDGDLTASDVLYPNFVAENYLLHYNKNQQWYWLPDPDPDTVLVFKAMDSHGFPSSGCPHGAFPLPDQKASLRESIDTRLLVMYADVDYPEAEPWSQSA